MLKARAAHGPLVQRRQIKNPSLAQWLPSVIIYRDARLCHSQQQHNTPKTMSMAQLKASLLSFTQIKNK